MTDDAQLLRQYTRHRSEEAFGELVRRHIDLVYSTALRVVNGDSHLAEDVTQMVFADLARKAWGLPADVVLAGWLHRHTSFTASKAVRTEQRRRVREQTAMEMNTLEADAEPGWERIAPHLDDGLNQLSAADRDAIVLRYLRQQDLRAVGAALGIGEDAAQKRVSRALEKLRSVLQRRGVTLTAAAMASALAAQTVSAAPAGLAVSVTATSLAAGATAGTGVSLAIMKVMAMTKLQLTAVGVVLIAAVATPLFFEHHSLAEARAENERIRAENTSLKTQAEQVAALAAENRRLSNLVAKAERGTAPVSRADQSELLRLRGKVTQLQADAKTNARSPGGVVDALANPAMKGMMEASYGAAVDRSYADFFATAGLPAEQAAALKELIMNREKMNLETALAMFSAKTDPAQSREATVKAQSQVAAYDEQIKQLLGDEGYAKLQNFEKTKSERMMMSMIENQMPAGSEISPDQRRQMITAMAEERQNFKFTVDFQDRGQQSIPENFTDAKIKQHAEEQDQLRQRYLARAGEIMTPEQVQVFDRSLKNQMQMEIAAVEMSVKMFAPKTGN